LRPRGWKTGRTNGHRRVLHGPAATTQGRPSIPTQSNWPQGIVRMRTAKRNLVAVSGQSLPGSRKPGGPTRRTRCAWVAAGAGDRLRLVARSFSKSFSLYGERFRARCQLLLPGTRKGSRALLQPAQTSGVIFPLNQLLGRLRPTARPPGCRRCLLGSVELREKSGDGASGREREPHPVMEPRVVPKGLARAQRSGGRTSRFVAGGQREMLSYSGATSGPVSDRLSRNSTRSLRAVGPRTGHLRGAAA